MDQGNQDLTGTFRGLFMNGGQQQAAPKPMRSYVDIDENGRASARIYTDEGDRVSGTVFKPFLDMAAQSYTRNAEVDDAARKAKMQAIKARFSEATTEQVEADLALAEAEGTGEADKKTGILGLFGPTYKQQAEKAKGKTESIRQMMESEFPEFSARRTVAQSEPAPPPQEQPTVASQAMPAIPSGFAPRANQVRIYNAKTGKFGYISSSDWTKNGKSYIAEGAILLP
jgi:hypothetical protein